MTVSDVPLASATRLGGVDSPPVRVRARARVGVTDGDVKIRAWWATRWSIMSADLRRWWLVAAEPPTLRAWFGRIGPDPLRVPGGSRAIRWAWLVDDYTTGLVFGGASIVLFLAAASARWLGCHPLRRWMAIIVLAATVAAWLIA